MKNERMSLIVWSFCFLCLPVLLHRCVLHVCMLVLPAKDQHTSGVLLPFLHLQETEVSPSKTVEVQMPVLISICHGNKNNQTQIVLIPPSIPLHSLLFMLLQNFWQWPYPDLEIQRRQMENHVSN